MTVKARYWRAAHLIKGQEPRGQRDLNGCRMGRCEHGSITRTEGPSPDSSSVKKIDISPRCHEKRAKPALFLICCEVCPAIPGLADDSRCCSRQRCPVSGGAFAWLALAPTPLSYKPQTGNGDQQQAGRLGHLVGGASWLAGQSSALDKRAGPAADDVAQVIAVERQGRQATEVADK